MGPSRLGTSHGTAACYQVRSFGRRRWAARRRVVPWPGAFILEEDTMGRGLAQKRGRQLPQEKKSRLSDVKEMFVRMRLIHDYLTYVEVQPHSDRSFG